VIEFEGKKHQKEHDFNLEDAFFSSKNEINSLADILLPETEKKVK
jgi:hypothetical protein